MEVKLVEKGFATADGAVSFQRLFQILGQAGVFPPGRPRERPGTQHLPWVLPTAFPSGPTAGPASLTGPAHALPLVWTFLQLEAEQEGNPQVPLWFLVARGARSEEQHCDTSDKSRLLPAVQTPGNNSPAAVRKAFSWGWWVPHQEPFHGVSPHPAQLLPRVPSEPGRQESGSSLLGHSTSHGATQML